jgi:transcriptional regulator with XRE-family HTH domain
MKSFTPELCRAARGLLAWGQRELAQRASVAHKTIADFELGVRRPYERTLKDVVAALEAGGVVFIAAQENVHSGGIALRWDFAARPEKRQGKSESSGADEGLLGKSWDVAFDERDASAESAAPVSQDILGQRAYWAVHPDRWVKLSEAGKALLTRELGL